MGIFIYDDRQFQIANTLVGNAERVEIENGDDRLRFVKDGTAKGQATGTLVYMSQTIELTAEAGGAADGLEGNAAAVFAMVFSGTPGSSYNPANNTLTVTVAGASGAATIANVVSAINLGTAFNAVLADGGNGATAATSAGVATAVLSMEGGNEDDVYVPVADGEDWPEAAEGALVSPANILAMYDNEGVEIETFDPSLVFYFTTLDEIIELFDPS